MEMQFFQQAKAQSRDQLMTVAVQDFGDDYHKDDYDPDDDLMNRVRMVRRRYNSTMEYQYAINIVNKYIAMLMIKYGGEQKFIQLLKAEAIDEYLPPIPKMKGGGKNKQLLKNGILMSPASFKRLDVERLEELRERYLEENMDNVGDIKFVHRDDEAVKEVNKIVEKEGVGKILRSYGRTMSLDLFEEFFTNRSSKRSYEHEEEQVSDITVSDILAPDYHERVIDIDDDGDEFVQYGNGFIHRDDVKTMDNINMLGKLGWNEMKLSRRIKGSSNITKIMRAESKKEQKRRKRREKAGDRFLLELSGQGDSHNSFGAFEEAMLDFTSKK